MTEMQLIENGEFQLRVTPGGDSFTVEAPGLARALGIRDSYRLVETIPVEEKGYTTACTPGGNQQVWHITESGFYRAIGQRQAARIKDDDIRQQVIRFQNWVYREVLPAIRRTGSYNAPAVPDMTTAQGRLQILDMAMKAERRALEAETQLKEQEPEVARARQLQDADGMALVGTVAKRFGIKERSLREFLFAEHLLIRVGSRRNEPYARYVESGHFTLKTRLVDVHPDLPPEERSTTYVTPKGEALIWRRLYAAGLVASPQMPGTQLELEGRS